VSTRRAARPVPTPRFELAPIEALMQTWREDPERWQSRGLCAQTDPEAFFPERGATARPSKRICAGCPVSAECLAYALEHDERYGIWGGTSPSERRAIRGLARRGES